MKMAGNTQLCQKDKIMGRDSSPAGAPSSKDTENFRVGPISRIARNPAQVISDRRIRWRKVNARSGVDDDGALETGVVVAVPTSAIVPLGAAQVHA